MHPLEKNILRLCRDQALILPGEQVLVGVSGGPDSLALLQVLARLRPELTCALSVAHVDHGLRPEAARAEEDLVRRAAAALGVECLVVHGDVPGQAAARGLSVEEAARELRYAFFAEAAARRQATKIAVAHTADDQAEEVLLRLLRGAGRKGLAGMPLLREGRIVRPLLTTPKASLLAYLHDRGIAFATDSSNTDRRYLRNRVRHDLLPFLAGFNPSINATLRQSAAILGDEDALLDEMAQANYALVARELTDPEGPRLSLDCQALTRRHIAVRRRIVEKALIALAAKPGFRHIEALIGLAAATGNGSLHLPNGLRVSKENGVLLCAYPRGRRASSWRGEHQETTAFHLLLPGPGRYGLPELGRELTVELLPTAPPMEVIRAGAADFLDAQQLTFPLEVRSRLPGDRFQPLSAPGRRKVADVLTDRKVPRAERGRLPILLSAGRIAALLGVRVAHDFRVTAATTTVVKVSLTPA